MKQEKPAFDNLVKPSPEKQVLKPPSPEPKMADQERRSSCQHQDIREKLEKERDEQLMKQEEEEEEAYHHLSEEQRGTAQAAAQSKTLNEWGNSVCMGWFVYGWARP